MSTQATVVSSTKELGKTTVTVTFDNKSFYTYGSKVSEQSKKEVIAHGNKTGLRRLMYKHGWMTGVKYDSKF